MGIKLAIVGSRSFSKLSIVREFIASLNLEETISEIVSGGAVGADALAEIYALEIGVPCKIFKPNWELHGRIAGMLRNNGIVNYVDALVAFWDGISMGTKHSIYLAEKKRIPTYICVV